MSLLGKAALAMWWDMSAQAREEFEHWHTHEHFPERLGIPGFLRANRWTDAQGDEGIFVMYELKDHQVLASAPYLARLNAPSPWSVKMMPHHRNMVRSQCHVLESAGIGTARHALTIRLSPAASRAGELRGAIAEMAPGLVMQPGLAGLHLLQHQAPAIAPTEEQRVRRNADREADWVLVGTGYDASSLRHLSDTVLSDQALGAMGAKNGQERGLYSLACSATPADTAHASQL